MLAQFSKSVLEIEWILGPIGLSQTILLVDTFCCLLDIINFLLNIAILAILIGAISYLCYILLLGRGWIFWIFGQIHIQKYSKKTRFVPLKGCSRNMFNLGCAKRCSKKVDFYSGWEHRSSPHWHFRSSSVLDARSGRSHLPRDNQGLVTVPFWVYWTSPDSSHYRPYT